MIFNAGQLAAMIKTAAKKDMPDFGEDNEQNTAIYNWITLYMFQYAKAIRVTETSDALAISPSDDYVTFTRSGNPITDMYEPYQMLDENERAAAKRTSFDNTNKGWYRESAFSPIHVRGLDGTFRLKYIRYPKQVTIDSDIPEISPSTYAELVSWVVGKLKLTKNYYQESQAMLADANAVRHAKTKAAVSGMGTNAQSPGPNDAELG